MTHEEEQHQPNKETEAESIMENGIPRPLQLGDPAFKSERMEAIRLPVYSSFVSLEPDEVKRQLGEIAREYANDPIGMFDPSNYYTEEIGSDDLSALVLLTASAVIKWSESSIMDTDLFTTMYDTSVLNDMMMLMAERLELFIDSTQDQTIGDRILSTLRRPGSRDESVGAFVGIAPVIHPDHGGCSISFM